MDQFLALKIKSNRYRRRLLRAIKKANAGHTGGSLSCIDILNVLYNKVLKVSPETFGDPDRDRFIHSKGHSVEALYTVLADRGFFPDADLDTLCCCQSPYVGHPTRKVNGIEQNTGALGHGLPIAAGIAIAGKLDDRSYRTFALMGDGELAEGSNWEAALIAGHYGLDTLTAIIDHNGLQITGPTREVCKTDPLPEKWRAFGWAVAEIDGHDPRELLEAFNAAPLAAGKPTMFIAKTVKGKGVPFMEHVGSWHHGVPDDQQYQDALEALEKEYDALTQGLSADDLAEETLSCQ
jgi:transketolase